jgi:hypothetical protein
MVNPPYGNGGVAIGCIANSRLANIPAAYSISSTALYPQTYKMFPTVDQTVIAGPFTYGSQLVITTDVGQGGPNLLMYTDTTDTTAAPEGTMKPMAGTLTVSVCVGPGSGAGPQW